MNDTNKNNTVLRFMTCGSVDDGKSTLIGRLLFDTKTILTDTLSHIEKTSKKRGMSALDLSLNHRRLAGRTGTRHHY
jgi:sulfate adenylyltransferase subunit 1